MCQLHHTLHVQTFMCLKTKIMLLSNTIFKSEKLNNTVLKGISKIITTVSYTLHFSVCVGVREFVLWSWDCLGSSCKPVRVYTPLEHRSKTCTMVLGCLMWLVWQECNTCTFEDKERSLDLLKSLLWYSVLVVSSFGLYAMYFYSCFSSLY